MRRLINRSTLTWTLTSLAVIGVGAAIKFAPPTMDEAVHNATLDVSATLGMRLSAVTVEGREMTSREDLLGALDLERGAPILSFDVAHAREAIEALPWVRNAKVERQLPGSVHIMIEERTPYALWQQGNRYTLVDQDGTPIVEVPTADQSLPLIVGPDAPKHAAELFQAIQADKSLAGRVRAAVRVGGRRWNVYLDAFEGGIAIRLPEDNLAAAWTRLAALERDHKILERDLDFIDLRQEDRLIVRVHKDPAAAETVKPATKKDVPVSTGPKQSI